MEIFLLLAVVLVGASGLFVAATFNRRAKQATKPLIDKAVEDVSDHIDEALTQKLGALRTGLARDLAGRENGSIQAQSEQIASLISEVKRQGTQTQTQVAQTRTQVAQIQARDAQIQAQVDQIADAVSRLTTMKPGKAEPAPAEIPAGEITVTEVTDPHHPLAKAVLEAESSCEREGWDNPPQLYALAGKAKLIGDDPELAAQIGEAPEDALIPVKQAPLDPGEPRAVLARVYWPDDVSGCVLVTELVMLPPEAGDEMPPDPAAVEPWARDQPDSQPARLAVGVTRDGRYTCVLRMKGEDTVRIDPGLADDLVTALLETL